SLSNYYLMKIGNLTERSEYKLIKGRLPDYVEEKGEIGAFYECLKTYKPISKWKISQPNSRTIDIEIGGINFLFSSSSITSVFSIETDELITSGYALECDLNLLGKNSIRSDYDIPKFNPYDKYEILLSSGQVFEKKKEINLSYLNHCLRTRVKSSDEYIETGVLKIKINSTGYTYIVHLSFNDDKIKSYIIEEYINKRDLLSRSGVIFVDCEIN
ncbi:hypothetical protein, partial [Vibrio penaeicida]